MRGLLDFLERRSRRSIYLLCITLIALVGVADFLTGPHISSAIFYAVPVSLASWYGNRPFAIAIAVAGAVSWYVADWTSGAVYAHSLIPVWNALTRLGFFLVLVYLLGAFHSLLRDTQLRATTDPLTGLSNHRGFYQAAELELSRAARYRHPSTIAYIDLDRFKQINDQFGHAVGDALLREVASVLRHYTRSSDIVARLGGDEFVVLMVETGAESAPVAVEALRQELLATMKEAGWPVTFSIGVVTYSSPPATVGDMVRAADELMYSVKRRGKDGYAHHVEPGVS